MFQLFLKKRFLFFQVLYYIVVPVSQELLVDRQVFHLIERNTNEMNPYPVGANPQLLALVRSHMWDYPSSISSIVEQHTLILMSFL